MAIIAIYQNNVIFLILVSKLKKLINLKRNYNFTKINKKRFNSLRNLINFIINSNKRTYNKFLST
jgi:hypothetical protein